MVLHTNKGKILIELSDSTPLHRDNFIKLCNEGFYDSLLFHRCIKNFVIQAGDPESKHAADTALLGNGDLGYTVPAEFKPSLFHKRGALGMARDDNPEKASSACQFYIVVGKDCTDSVFIKAEKRTGLKIPDDRKEFYRTSKGIPHLDMLYTVFGEVLKGMKVVDRIVKEDTDANDRPLKPVRIRRTKVIEMY